MQGLQHLSLAGEEIRVSDKEGESFFVRGLSPVSAVRIYRQFSGEVAQIFDDILSKAVGSDTPGPLNIEAIIVQMLDAVPEVVEAIIVEAAGGDCSSALEQAVVRRIPFGPQMAALIATFNQTFTSEMPPKKFLEIVVTLLRQVGSAPELT